MKYVHPLLIAVLFILSACAPAATAMPSQATEPPASTEAPAASPVPEIVHIKIGILNYLSFAPFFIAQEEGYFAEQGLEAEFVDFGSTSTEIIPGLLQRQLDVATTTLSAQALNAIAEGEQLRYVADKGYVNPDAACASDAWVGSASALDSSALTDDFASLSGKKAVAFKANVFEYAFDVMLDKAGLSPEDVEFVDVKDNPTRLEALKAGTIDLTVLGEPWVTRAEKAGDGRIWVPFSKVIPQLPVGTVAFGPSLLEDHPDVGVRFMIAYLKAVRQFDAEGKSDRNIEIISKYTKITPEELKDICWNSFKTDGSIDEAPMQKFIQWAVDKGYVSAPLTFDQVWDPQFVNAANAALGK